MVYVVIPFTIVTLGVIIGLLGLPLWRRNVPRNELYGLKTRATLASDAVWYEANARSGLDLIAFGVVLATVGLTLGLLRVNPFMQIIAGNGVAILGCLFCVVRGVLHARRLARSAEKRSADQVID